MVDANWLKLNANWRCCTLKKCYDFTKEHRKLKLHRFFSMFLLLLEIKSKK